MVIIYCNILYVIYSTHTYRWINNGSVRYDTQQDLINTSTTLSNGIRTVIFTRPIISSDNVNDTDLNTCHYAGWGIGGSVESVTPGMAASISGPTQVGSFDGQVCITQPSTCLPQGMLLVLACFY